MKIRISLLALLSIFLFQACCSEEEGKSNMTIEDNSILSDSQKQEYLLEGKRIAKQTFLSLSTALKSKIEEGGIVGAVDYCNIAAYSLTDSIAQANNVILRRASNRFRNPSNKPNLSEEKVINTYLVELSNGNKLKPQIIKENGEVHFYAPIETKPLCLSCHGEPGKFISESDYAFIKEKYPNDLAINFKTGDLRGIWSITFPEK